MTDFLRFPHTPHLAWLGTGSARGDKVLAPQDVSELLAGDVVVEEKVDGANLGFSVDGDGVLRAQNRGSYLHVEHLRGQWKQLGHWLSAHRQGLVDALTGRLILFGEWCYAVHSVRYACLPDWFLAFDVYDVARAEFWSVARRDALAAQLGLSVVPLLGRGRYDLQSLTAMLGHSQIGDGPAEGLYVRREKDGRLLARAKLVRAEFVQSIEEHWSKRPLEVNRLAGNNGGDRSWR